MEHVLSTATVNYKGLWSWVLARGRWRTMTRIADKRHDLQGQGRDVTWSVYGRPITREWKVSETPQEGWLSPTERASVSAISLRHNLATSVESRRYVVAFTRFAGWCVWLPQESIRHILSSPGYAWDNRSKWYMNGKRIQCLSNASQHVPIYLQPFTSYSVILVRNCNFFLPLAFNAPVGGVPIGIPGKRLVLKN